MRGIHAQNKESEAGISGQRCALNITGADLKSSEVHRGVAGLSPMTSMPRSHVFRRPAASFENGGEATTPLDPCSCPFGAAEVPGRIAILGDKSVAPGSSGLVQVVLDRRIGVLKGDGFIIRDQSAQRTIAGASLILFRQPGAGPNLHV